VLVVAQAQDVVPAVTQLIRIGLDDIRGYVVADPSAWRDAGIDVQTVEQLSPAEAGARIESGAALVVDVRNDMEWESGHIPDAAHVAVERLSRGDTGGIDPTQPVIVTCAAGYRSSLATSLLKRAGFHDVANLSGGMGAWESRNGPVVRDRAEVSTH
jgi:hydroxyacylglutathione hydrolase